MKESFLKKIENLFEPEMILEQFSFLQESIEYKIEDRFEWIENIGLFKTTSSNKNPDWNLFFSRLAPFFEFGLLFDSENLKHSFFRGRFHDLTQSEIMIKLPHSPHFEIFKTSSERFLKKIKIDHLLNYEKWSCYYIRATQEISFIVFTEKAEPWNKLMMESLQKAMINFAV